MNAVRPPVTQLLLHPPAGEVEPTFVEVGAETIGSGHPHHHGCAVGDQPEPLLALANGGFRAAADEDVGKNLPSSRIRWINASGQSATAGRMFANDTHPRTAPPTSRGTQTRAWVPTARKFARSTAPSAGI